MNTMLDILGSTVIGLYFIYMILTFNIKMNNSLNIAVENNITVWDTIELGKLSDYDFNKIGYRTDSVFVFAKATDTELIFSADLDNDGVVETVHYVLGSESDALYTDNEDDKPLYRIINSTDTTTSLVKSFKFTYNDASGAEITTSLSTHTARKEIKGITVNFTIVAAATVDTIYQEMDWQKKFTPRNI